MVAVAPKSASAPKPPDPARRITVLVNAHAGGADGHDIPERIHRAFADASGTAEIEALESGADIDRRARALARDGSILVAAGGDGTVSAVASAVVANGGTLGVIPIGTLNHFAKDIGVPLDLAGAVRLILEGHVARVDVGEVNGRIFLNNSSLGLYPRMIWEREEERRLGRSKWVAFAIAAARIWRNYRTLVVHLTLDGEERVIETPFVFVGNNEYQATGLNLGGRSSLTGGALSLYVAPACGRFDVMRLMLRALVTRHDDEAGFDSWRLQNARVETSRHRVSVAADGELFVMSPPLRYRIHPGRLPVIVPSDANAT